MPVIVPVLLYHDVGESASLTSTPSDLFAWQMRWLHDHAFQIIPLQHLVSALTGGQPLPGRSVVLTFDDGFASVYTHAAPILAEYGYPATVFVVADYVGKHNDWPGQPVRIPRRPLLSWDQVRLLHEQGLEIGAHSLTHPFLDRLSPEDARREIDGSRRRIEDELGSAVTVFAYPYGRHGPQVRAITQQTFAAACAARLGLVGPGSDPFALERVEIYYLRSRRLFQLFESSLFAGYLRTRSLLRTTSGILPGRPWR